MKKQSPEDTLAVIFEVFRAFKRISDKRLRSPVPLLYIETLRFVRERSSAPSMRDIAEYLCIAPPSATEIVDSLVRKKYLERSSDASDRRRVRVALSPLGERFLSQTQAKRMQAFTESLGSLPQKDLADLTRIFLKLKNYHGK